MSDIQLIKKYNKYFNLEVMEPTDWTALSKLSRDPETSILKALGAKVNKNGQAKDRMLNLLENCFVDAIYYRKMDFVHRHFKVVVMRITELRYHLPKLKGVQTMQTITYIPSKANEL